MRGRLSAGRGRATTCTSTLAAFSRGAVGVLLSPKLYFLFLGALDAPFAHLHIVLYLCLRELSVLPEDDVEAQAEYAQAHKYQSCKQYFHIKINKFRRESVLPAESLSKSVP